MDILTIKHELIKRQFDMAASFYGVNNTLPVSHIFATRIQRISELLGDLNGLKILDVGCGPGFIMTLILEKNGHYFGFDLSQKMLHEAKMRHNFDTPFYLSLGEVENLPFKDNSFDLSLCLGVLEYVEDLDRTLAEISRVLREDSTIILSMQNKNSIYRWWERHVFPGFLFNALRKLLHKTSLAPPVERLVPIKKFKEILSRHNFTVKEVVYYNFNVWVKPLDRWFPGFSIRTAKKLEVLSHSMLGVFLAADFLIKTQRDLL